MPSTISLASPALACNAAVASRRDGCSAPDSRESDTSELYSAAVLSSQISRKAPRSCSGLDRSSIRIAKSSRLGLRVPLLFLVLY